MNSIALPLYQQLLARLNQMPIRGNRHKMAVYVNLNPDQEQVSEPSLVAPIEEEAVVAFHILFERNNGESAWRLMTPLRFIEQGAIGSRMDKRSYRFRSDSLDETSTLPI